jgi:hypothetical protein
MLLYSSPSDATLSDDGVYSSSQLWQRWTPLLRCSLSSRERFDTKPRSP